MRILILFVFIKYALLKENDVRSTYGYLER